MQKKGQEEPLVLSENNTKMERQAQLFNLTGDIAEILLEGFNETRFYQLLCSGTTKIFGGIGSGILLLNPTNSHLVLTHIDLPNRALQLVQDTLQMPFPEIHLRITDTPFLISIMNSRAPRIISDDQDIDKIIHEFIQTDAVQRPFPGKVYQNLATQIVKRMGLNSLIYLPLIGKNGPFGMLGIFSETGFTEADAEALSPFAAHISSVLQTYGQIPAQGQEREKSAETTAKKTDREATATLPPEKGHLYRTLFEHSPSGIMVEAPDGTIIDANPAVCRSFGYSRRELIGKNIAQFSTDNKEQIAQNIKAVLDGGYLEHEVHNLLPGGREIILQLREFRTELSDGSMAITVISDDITERQRIENELKISEEHHRRISAMASDYYYILVAEKENQFRFSWHGGAFNRITGYTFNNFETPQSLYDQIHQDDRETLSGALVRANKGLEATITYRFRHAAGHYIWLQETLTGQLTDSANHNHRIFAVVRDVTESEKNRRALSEREELYRSIIEQSSDSIYLASSEDMKFIEANPSFMRLTGYTAKDLAAMTVFDLLAHPREEVEQNQQSIDLNHRGFLGKRTYRTKDNRLIFVDVNVSVIFYSGKRVMCVVARDITERERLAEEKQRMQERLYESQKMQSLAILAGGIAHDFNNLLVGVLGNASLALEDLPRNSELRPILEQIQQSGERAADLSRQMLAYSGRGKFLIKNIQLNDLITEMASLLQVSIHKDVTLEYDFNASLPQIRGDITEMRQVIMNLIINAAESIQNRAGMIKVTTGWKQLEDSEIQAALYSDKNEAGPYVWISVADNGSGIKPIELKKIFEPYYSTKNTGRGLGLAALLGIVRGHQGLLNVTSQPGEGTTFKIWFPAAEPVESKEEDEPRVTRVTRGKGTVLIADDEPSVRMLAERMLHKEGFTTFIARDGREALEVFQQHIQEISLVLLDQTMPHLKGSEIYRKMLEMKESVIILFTSGYTESEIERLTSTPNVAFLAKPYTMVALRDKIQKLLSQ
jgi:two-component system cell cycle sensor histidine kinase/response regulator CckA